MSNIKLNIVDQDRVRNELVNLLRQTPTFKDANFIGTNLAALVNLFSYNAELWSYYINQIANEPYLDTAKLYKNLNRIANSLGYNPIGWGQSQVEVTAELSNDYVLTSKEGYIQIPAYSTFGSSKASTVNGNVMFTNEKPILIQIRQFGTHPVNYSDFEYNGKIGSDGTLISNKLQLPLREEKQAYILGDKGDGKNGILAKISNTMYSSLGNDITEFKVDTEYSLVLRYVSQEWTFEIKAATTTPITNEIAKFKVETDGSITFIRNTSTGILNVGRLGYQNLEYIKFNAVSTNTRKDILSKLQMILPQGSPLFQVMYNGEILSFDASMEDIIIETDNIPSNFFTKDVDIFAILEIIDRRKKNYGARLVLKPYVEIGNLDVVILGIPVNNETFEEVSNGKGDLLLTRNKYIEQEETKQLVVKTGTINLSSDEYQKRVIFDQPFEFYLPTKNIPADSAYDYSIMITPSGNVTTFWSNKTTEGFIINVEPNTGFEGTIVWKAIAYKREIVQEKEVNISKLSYLVNIDEGFSVLLQPQLNASIWLSNVSGSGFSIVSDSAFIGDIDYLVIPKSNIGTANEYEESGSTIIPTGQTTQVITFSKERPSNDYRVFLQPNKNVKVWPGQKKTTGFTIFIEPATNFSGRIDWQIHEGTLSGTVTIKGGEIVGDYNLEKAILDISEKHQLGLLKQGQPNVSIIEPGGTINSNLNSLSLWYYNEPSVIDGLRYTINETSVSYTGIRVFVYIDDAWIEFIESSKYTGTINYTSTVFYVRTNKDRISDIWFGNDDMYGFSPINYKIAIIGYVCSGPNGNIVEDTLLPYVDATCTFDFSGVSNGALEPSLLKELKLMQSNNIFVSRTIIDHNEEVISGDILAIKQMGPAFLGSSPENEEQIRKNAKLAYFAQDRLVSNMDYRNKILNNFSNIVIDASVYNYMEAQQEGLISELEVAKYYYNTIFLLLIPTYGTYFTIGQKNMIQNFINNDFRKQSTIETIILEPSFVNIDVMVSYRESKDVSPVYIQNNIVNSITNFFDKHNRKLGELISKYDLQQNISTEGIDYLNIKMNKDVNNSLFSTDYDVDIPYASYEDKFADIEKKKLNDIISKELKNLQNKGLITINQPLFDYEVKTGERVFPFTEDIQMNKFEFPILGDIIIERKP